MAFSVPTGAAAVPVVKGRKARKAAAGADAEVSGEKRNIEHRGATTLDRVHAAMLLQAGRRANALRALLKAGGERGPDFVRVGNAFTALYPAGSGGKRSRERMVLCAPKWIITGGAGNEQVVRRRG